MEKTYTIELTQNDLNVVGAALGELPFKMSAPVISKLNQQIAEQEVEDGV